MLGLIRKEEDIIVKVGYEITALLHTDLCMGIKFYRQTYCIMICMYSYIVLKLETIV